MSATKAPEALFSVAVTVKSCPAVSAWISRNPPLFVTQSLFANSVFAKIWACMHAASRFEVVAKQTVYTQELPKSIVNVNCEHASKHPAVAVPALTKMQASASLPSQRLVPVIDVDSVVAACFTLKISDFCTCAVPTSASISSL